MRDAPTAASRCLFVDLLGVNQINDSYGHEVGDHLLSGVADRIRQAIGPDDIAVRYGGDEFVVLCPDVTNVLSTETDRVAVAAGDRGALPDGRRGARALGVHRCGGHRGAAGPPRRGADRRRCRDASGEGAGPGPLLDVRSVDARQAHAGDRRAPAPPGARTRAVPPLLPADRLAVDQAARRQPRHCCGGTIPTAASSAPTSSWMRSSSTGLIVPVGNWVLDEVCRQAFRWQHDYPDRPALNLKVNVSPRQLAQSGFVPHLRECLATSQADPDRICLEVNERGLLDHVETAWSTLREAKALGVSLALDDFGTGYSSLGFLRTFNLDLLSIDRSFVAGHRRVPRGHHDRRARHRHGQGPRHRHGRRRGRDRGADATRSGP